MNDVAEKRKFRQDFRMNRITKKGYGKKNGKERTGGWRIEGR